MEGTMKDRINQLLKEGKTIPEIAKATGLYSYHIKKMLTMGVSQDQTDDVDHPDNELISQIIEDYTTDPFASTKDVGDKHGRTAEFVYAVLERHGIPILAKGGVMASVEKTATDAQIIDMLEERGTIAGAAKSLGLPEHHLMKYIKEKKITFQPRCTPYRLVPEETKREIIFDYVECRMKKDAVMAKHRVSRHTVEAIIREYNTGRSCSIVPPERKHEMLKYSKKVRRLSVYFRGLYGEDTVEGYHWNHRLSIIDGFLGNVPEEILASMVNLELIPKKENMSIGFKSKITKEQLYREYTDYLNGKITYDRKDKNND